MKSLFENIIKNHDRFFQVFIVFLFSLIITFSVSDKTIHSFDFEKGSNWNYDDLYADFRFSLFKNQEEIQKNKRDIEFFSDVYYEKDTLIKMKKKMRKRKKINQTF